MAPEYSLKPWSTLRRHVERSLYMSTKVEHVQLPFTCRKDRFFVDRILHMWKEHYTCRKIPSTCRLLHCIRATCRQCGWGLTPVYSPCSTITRQFNPFSSFCLMTNVCNSNSIAVIYTRTLLVTWTKLLIEYTIQFQLRNKQLIPRHKSRNSIHTVLKCVHMPTKLAHVCLLLNKLN